LHNVFWTRLRTNNDAAILRGRLIEEFRGEAIPIKGEHKELIAIHKRHFGDNHDLCRVELDLAVHHIDAIVFLPSSPGSLVELGMFAFYPNICKKTLILFSKEFENPTIPSFIWGGPRVAYQIRGASIEFVDYSQTDSVLKLVKEFVSKMRALKYDNNLLKFAMG